MNSLPKNDKQGTFIYLHISHENSFLPGLLKFLLGEGQDQLVVVGRPREGTRSLGRFGRSDVVEIRNGLLGAGTDLALAAGHSLAGSVWYGSVAVALWRGQKCLCVVCWVAGIDRLVGTANKSSNRA